VAILDRAAAQGFDTFTRRPKLGKADFARILWAMVRGR
jgi:hypothetical protein